MSPGARTGKGFCFGYALNMRRRIYDPQTRNFLTPDPIIAVPYHINGWHRYSYGLNNPFVYGDLTGLFPTPGERWSGYSTGLGYVQWSPGPLRGVDATYWDRVSSNRDQTYELLNSVPWVVRQGVGLYASYRASGIVANSLGTTTFGRLLMSSATEGFASVLAGGPRGVASQFFGGVRTGLTAAGGFTAVQGAFLTSAVTSGSLLLSMEGGVLLGSMGVALAPQNIDLPFGVSLSNPNGYDETIPQFSVPSIGSPIPPDDPVDPLSPNYTPDVNYTPSFP
jgi:RHS repeat-associated protein